MRKIIIVDDEPEILETFAYIINWSDYGFTLVKAFDNATDAYNFLSECYVDVIISDIRMPKMDGIEFSKLVYKNYPNVAFVMLSAHRDFQYAIEAMRHNSFDYLTKPFDFNELESLLSRLSAHFEKSELKEDDLLSWECQQFIFEFYKGTITQDELIRFFEKNNFYFSIEDSPVALLNIFLPDLIDYLKKTWSYGIDRLYACIIRFLFRKDIYFIPLKYSFNNVEILAISSGTDRINLEYECKQIAKSIPITCMEELNLNLSFSTIGVLSNLDEAGEYIRNIINLIDVSSKKPQNTSTIIKAKSYIDNNFTKEISLTEVAEHVCLSPYHFSRLYKKTTGENFSDYITKKRLEEASRLLATEAYKTTQIAQMVGYHNKNFFYKMFKSYFGVTPRDYKASIKEE